MFIGVYGNYDTWRLMQNECDRYADPNWRRSRYMRNTRSSQPVVQSGEEKTNATPSIDACRTD